MQHEVSYLDVVNGGSGCTRMPLDQVPQWLARRPGLVIRSLEPIGNLEESHVYQTHRKAGRHNLANQLINQAR